MFALFLLFSVIALFGLFRYSKAGFAVVACCMAASITWSLLPPRKIDKTVDRLVEQVRGEKIYWDTNGKEVRLWHGTWHEAFEQVYAAKQLAQLGAGAAEALPDLKAELANGVENIDIGDGVIHLKDEIEQAIMAIESDLVERDLPAGN